MRHLIGSIVLSAFLAACGHLSSGPVAPAAAPAITSSVEARLDSAFAATLEGKVTGTVLVGEGDRIQAVRTFADPAQPFRPAARTVYDLASIGKTFTAVLALRLAEMEAFDLDAPLRTYLPELPEEMSDITGRNALAHDAGLPRYLEGDDLVRRSAAEALTEIAAIKRERKAGSGYYYSNVGPQLVALALQRAGNGSYENLVRRLIFDPLRMSSASFHGDPDLLSVGAPAFSGGKRQGSPAEWPSTWSMLGAAGVAASVEDMWRFKQGVFTGSLLRQDSRGELLSPGVSTNGRGSFKTPDTLDIHYGAGLFHFSDRKARTIHFHGGSSDFGSSTAMLWRQEDDVFVVALFNSTSDAYDRGKFILATLEAFEPPQPVR